MTTVSLPYTYADGSTLDVDQHNDNIYDATLASGVGVMSTANGGLSSVNLDSAFKVQADHVQPGEVFRGHQAFQYDSIDIFDDAVGTMSEEYRPIAGCALRVYFPYAVSVALWQCSCFVSSWRPHIDNTTGSLRYVPSMKVKMALDGTDLGHTERDVPLGFYQESAVGKLGLSYEERAGLYYDIAHLAEDVSAGWHDISFRVFMEKSQNGNQAVQTLERSVKTVSVAAATRTYARLTAGIRNARVLTIL